MSKSGAANARPHRIAATIAYPTQSQMDEVRAPPLRAGTLIERFPRERERRSTGVASDGSSNDLAH